MNAYRRTDLATELDLGDREGINENHRTYEDFEITSIEIVTESASKRLSKPIGKYVTISIGKLWLASDSDFEKAGKLIAEHLESLALELVGHQPERILIVGLGNRRITADALGDECVGLITVTRHIKSNKHLYDLLGGREISALTPGVLGQTGIESSELVSAACKMVNPELVIAIDSLCAMSTDRLATTVQLGTSGINPGSGVGNRRGAINKETLGVPVIALGVPTVVDSSTLVIDALEKAGITEISDELINVLENGKGFFVTPKETDTIIRELSRLCANSLSEAFI